MSRKVIPRSFFKYFYFYQICFQMINIYNKDIFGASIIRIKCIIDRYTIT